MFRQLSELYADHNPAMRNSSSCLKYSWLGPTTNGAAWYPKNGTLKDWSYRETNSLDLVLELSCCKYPVEYFLPREWDNNYLSLLLLIEQAQTGVRGLVLRGESQVCLKFIFSYASICSNICWTSHF